MTRSSNPLVKGALLMSLGFFFVALFGLLLKEIARASSLFFAVWVTYATALVLQVVAGVKEGKAFFQTKHHFKHFCRGFFGAGATLLYAVALKHILLMNATLLFNTTPLFVPLLAALFLKNRVPWYVWLAVALGFIGVVIIIHPSAQIVTKPWELIGLASGFCLAIAFIFVKLLNATEPVGRILFYFFLFGTLIASCTLPLAWSPPSLAAWGLGILSGIVFVLCQLCIVKSYEISDASAVGPFQYLSVLFAGIFDYLFFRQMPHLSDYIGSVLVVLGGVLVIVLSRPKQKHDR